VHKCTINIKGKKAEKLEPVTFADLKMLESDIEEILRTSIDILCDDEESMLVVGRQVKNEMNGRSDLTAVDSNGNIVLIEIKRDRKDIEGRAEAFEFQAIRYAASYATIKNTEELLKKVYAPYIEKYKTEYVTWIPENYNDGGVIPRARNSSSCFLVTSPNCRPCSGDSNSSIKSSSSSNPCNVHFSNSFASCIFFFTYDK